MDELHGRAPRSPRWPLAVWTLALAAFVAGCETTPRPGAFVTAQVLDVPRTRAALKPLYGDLHAAIFAGVAREDAARRRLVLGECAAPDPTAPGGMRFPVATVVLPESVQPRPGTLLDLSEITSAPGATGRFHGRFQSVAPPLEAAGAVRSPFGDRLHTRCGAAGSGLRVQLRRAVDPSELDFARAEVRRHQSLQDEDLAHGRVVIVACQLKVADGGDWYRPAWVARVPAGVQAKPGQVVRLRTGAAEGSTDTAPLAEVTAVEAVAAATGNAVVRCY